MRLGCFWGQPITMALLAFPDEPMELSKLLHSFRKHASADSVLNVKKELAYLIRILDQCSWKLPDCQETDPQNPIEVVNGHASDELDTAMLKTEFCQRVFKYLVEQKAKGTCYAIPVDFKAEVDAHFDKSSFSSNRMQKEVRNLVKSWEKVQDSNLDSAAIQIGAEKVPPTELICNGKLVKMTEEQQKIWQFYSIRLNAIKKMYEVICSPMSEETTIFGLSFLNIVNSKGGRIKYLVSKEFQRVSDSRMSNYLSKCIDDCRENIQEFKKLLQKYVNVDGSFGTSHAELANVEDSLRTANSSASVLIESARRDGRLRLERYKKEDILALVKLTNSICNLSGKAISEIFEVDAEIEQIVNWCNEMGLYGVNAYGSSLLYNSFSFIALGDEGKINKSKEYLEELNDSLEKIDALLDSMIPIGTKLEKIEEEV